MIAADLETGEMVVLSEGPLIPAMLATSAFPIVFGPVYHQGHWLVDGGVLNNLPFDIVRQLGADRVVGVNVPPGIHNLLKLPEENEKRPRLSPQSIFAVIARPGDWKLPLLVAEASVAMTAALVNRKRETLCPPDLLLDIPILNTGTFMADNSKEIVEGGARTAMESMADQLRLREHATAPAWQRQLDEVGWRLRRAWEAYKAPRYPMFPARNS
jgi:NTE family protein